MFNAILILAVTNEIETSNFTDFDSNPVTDVTCVTFRSIFL